MVVTDSKTHFFYLGKQYYRAGNEGPPYTIVDVDKIENLWEQGQYFTTWVPHFNYNYHSKNAWKYLWIYSLIKYLYDLINKV